METYCQGLARNKWWEFIHFQSSTDTPDKFYFTFIVSICYFYSNMFEVHNRHDFLTNHIIDDNENFYEIAHR